MSSSSAEPSVDDPGSFQELFRRECELLVAADWSGLLREIRAIPDPELRAEICQSLERRFPRERELQREVVRASATSQPRDDVTRSFLDHALAELGKAKDSAKEGVAAQAAPDGRETRESASQLRRREILARGHDILNDLAAMDDGSEVSLDPATKEPRVTFVSSDRVGLALSGGGIRSATFNLGLLHGLQSHKILRHVDYLATVSGGGYIGSWWAAWKHRFPASGEFPGDEPSQHQELEPQEIRHLREFSNFLVPQPGFHGDVWEGVAAIITGLIPTIFLAVFLLLSVLKLWLAAILVAGIRAPVGPPILMFGATLIGLIWLESVWRRHSGIALDGSDARCGGNAYWGGALLGAALVGTLAWYFGRLPMEPRTLRSWLATETLGYEIYPFLAYSLFPAAAWCAAIGMLAILRPFLEYGIWQSDPVPAAAYRRVLGNLLKMSLPAIGLALLWFVARYLWENFQQQVQTWWATLSAIGPPALAAEFFRRIRNRTETPSEAKTGSWTSQLQPLIPRFLAYFILAWCFVAISIAWIAFVDKTDSPQQRSAVIAILGIFVIVMRYVDPEQLGLRAFYRNRLVRAYLGASNPAATAVLNNRCVVATKEEDIPLSKMQPANPMLQGLQAPSATAGTGCPPSRPIHLICCAANDLSGDQLATLGRGGRSAAYSPLGFSIGNHCRRPGGTTLGAAMTASGAAFNPQMGSLSRDLGSAVPFLLGALNLRLGMWTDSPKGAPTSPGSFPGWELMKEFWASSCTDLDSVEAPARVHLSDGGHFENMGLYELVRRHCRYIIVSDCGADPDQAFDDFGRAQRRIREDFGVEIDIDVSPLMAGPDGRSKQHMVVGTIYYGKNSDDQGILLLFKPTLTGDEPDDVKQYQMRNKAFPQEATSDQFYDEAQWEAYRRLGEHAARSALRFLETTPDLKMSRYGFFTEAYWHWFPTPPSLNERMLNQTERLTCFMDRLRQSSNPALCELISDAAVGGVAPSLADAQTFSLIMEMAQVMEDAFTDLDLARTASLPLTVGWMNMFHRWTRSEEFRRWWPVIRPMFGQEFRQFLTNHCGLENYPPPFLEYEPRTILETDAAGLGASRLFRWYQERRRVDPPPDRKFMVFEFEGPGSFRLELGLLEYEERNDPQVGFVVEWSTQQLFVAPTFRNVNVLLTYLPRALDRFELQGFAAARVRLDQARLRTDKASRDFHGNLLRLYKAVGFKLRREAVNGQTREYLEFRL